MSGCFQWRTFKVIYGHGGSQLIYRWQCLVDATGITATFSFYISTVIQRVCCACVECVSCVMCLMSAAVSDQYKTYVVFHGVGYTVYDPALCRATRVVSAEFDLSTRRSTRLQLTSASRHVTTNNSSSSSRLCDVTCDWGDAVMVGSEFIYATQPRRKRVIVIDVKDSHRPVEVRRARSTLAVLTRKDNKRDALPLDAASRQSPSTLNTGHSPSFKSLNLSSPELQRS